MIFAILGMEHDWTPDEADQEKGTSVIAVNYLAAAALFSLGL